MKTSHSMKVVASKIILVVILSYSILAGCVPIDLSTTDYDSYEDIGMRIVFHVAYSPIEKVKSSLGRLGLNKSQWGRVLLTACTDDRVDVAEYALSMGADINAYGTFSYTFTDGYMGTPLSMAVAKNSPKMVQLLLQYAPDPTIRDTGHRIFPHIDSIRRTPLEYAVADGSKKEIINLLTAYGEEYGAFAAAKKLDTAEAYQGFLDAHPQSVLAGQAASGLKKVQDKMLAEQEAATKKRELEQRIEAQENKLPATVRRDKYMISLVQLLQEKRFAEAIPYCEKLSKLPLKQDPSLDYYYGEALMQTGESVAALEKLYHYISTQGSGAPLYKSALMLVNEIESKQ